MRKTLHSFVTTLTSTLVLLVVLASSSLLMLSCLPTTSAFVVPRSQQRRGGLAVSSLTTLHQSSSSETETDVQSNNSNSNNRIDVVLFGIGDLRVDDHGGLQAALAMAHQNNQSNQNTIIVPLVVLDPHQLHKIPMATSHAMDTMDMIVAAVEDLKQSLHTQFGLELQIIVDGMDDDRAATATAATAIVELVQQQQQSEANADVHIHVCDLDPVDNAMGYGPYSSLVLQQTKNDNNHVVVVHPWTCHLRDDLWTSTSKVTSESSYREYEQMTKRNTTPMLQPPIDTPRRQIISKEQQLDTTKNAFGSSMTTTTTVVVPTSQQLLDSILRVTSSSSSSTTTSLDDQQQQQQQRRRFRDEQGTGLFGTHWGRGVSSSSVSETSVWQTVQDYCIDCQENDEVWMTHPSNPMSPFMQPSKSTKSLEHASMLWMMMNNNNGDNTPSSTNWIAGECMTRYLAAPLWLGTISPRRLMALSSTATNNNSVCYTSALQRMVDGREWHKLLAAAAATTCTANDDTTKLEYGYWRWHGFLCRYAKKNLTTHKTNNKKDALLLVHGFGASSTQWQRSIQALEEQQQQQEASSTASSTASSLFDQVLAPDLIGFGHCEKPALTYTQYLWSGFVSDFAKEVGIGNESWDTFVIGGNSIGGYTSMGVAADDSVKVGDNDDNDVVVSSMGAPGSNRCIGLTLFNSAGNIRTKEEIAAMRRAEKESDSLLTVAQMTATAGGLPPCSPPPRPVARLFGNALLAYLRPNIGPICKKVYPTNPDAADDALAKHILRDSLDPGAVNVMISGSKLPIPRTANELLGADFGSALDAAAAVPSSTNGANGAVKEGMFTGPVLVAQGMLDPLNDAKSRATMLSDLRKGITVAPIHGGHCPHDEMPHESMRALLQWNTNLQQRTASAAAAQGAAVLPATSSSSSK